ncbi:hypothetical protein K432DRAFT_264910, partial [Lepidopterella palustris CBS 459.81]
PTTAQAVVQAGSSPVHVGTLSGGELYTSISSALEKLCPPVTQTTTSTLCTTTGVAIKGIPYIEMDSLATDGELVVKVDASSYNVTSLRDAMIHSAALTAQKASLGKNCYTKRYTTEALKRDITSSRFWPRHWLLEGRDHPYPVKEDITLCNSVSFAAVQYYDQFWRLAPQPGPTDFIYAHWEFHVGPGGMFACDFLGDLADALAAIEPEFAVGEV